MARKATGEVQEFVVGQLEDVRRKLQDFEKELVKRGKAQQRELEGLLKGVRQGKQLKALEKRANAAGSQAKKRLDALQDSVLGALGVASRAELTQVHRELGKLAKKVDALIGRKNPATAS